MAKKRTKKNKSEAKHPFLVDWDFEAEKTADESSVKGKNDGVNNSIFKKTIEVNKTKKQEELDYSGTARHDIIRTLLIAVFILGVELVLYLTL